MPTSLAIDIGGTFTDVVLRRGDGALFVDKVLTTHDDLLEGLFKGVDLVLARAGARPADVDGVVVHATTIVTNALIERRGAPTAMLVTRGFADVLFIRNEHRYDMYDPQIEFSDPIVPRDLTFEIEERVLADGTIEEQVDPAEVERIAATLTEKGVASAAVCLLNSFRNPANEQAVAAALCERAPSVSVSLSSTVAPQIREYPRASTTAINAYARPVAQPYLEGLAAGLAAAGVRNAPLIMLSSGGVIGAGVAAQNPVRMIESGPAAGALAAAWYAERLGLGRLMSFDMGGTTAKACLIDAGKPLVTGTFEVDRKYRFLEGSGLPVTVPSIDMIEIGAGGGSIAAIDALGLLKVGPRSAGSSPGPACYGLGGTDATVTDADVVLGLIDPAQFLGGDMPLDRARAERAFAPLAERLGVGIEAAAAGAYRIVAEAMAGAARAHAADRGVDHRGLSLLAFGGAGPVHACEVGSLLGSAAVIFPPQASVLSAFGALVTPVRLDLARSALGRLDALQWDQVDALLDDMSAEGLEALAAAGCPERAARLTFGADLRYFGQQNELSVAFDHDPRRDRDIGKVCQRFESAYRTLYGVNPSHVPIEIVSWRLTLQGPESRFEPAPPETGQERGPKARRIVALWPDQPTPVFDRAALVRGQRLTGPAIVEERETTIVLPPGWRAVVDDIGCLAATRDS
ncbi:MAG TPA: hydantoinase/oxoprolinase family protein [Caulobacteraceae bacterium]|nr:hydantoinase/oxoprolinase family protein [Caulobacteraceae bacterium]